MANKRRVRRYDVEEPVQGHGRSDRWEEKRRRFADDGPRGSRPLSPTFFLTVGAVSLVVIFIVVFSFRGDGASTASATVLQQVPATTTSAAAGKVGVTVQEVQEKKLVYWDYKTSTGKNVPLMAYVAPSGAVKLATRLCEPCNGYSFRIEGNQLVCNSCGTRWDLETSKGISGGCQTYPPEVLQATMDDGKITVDDTILSNWQPRV